MALVCYVALARFMLYLVAAPNYGYFRDELYYLACAEHPAWGYVDQPPLIAWTAWLLRHSIGTSLYALRLLPMLSDLGTIVMTGLLARELGGKRWAMFLSALAVLAAPLFLLITHLFTMNALDLLLWTVLAWLMVKLVKTADERLWLWVGALVGVALLNKYAVLFVVIGFLAGVVASPLRRTLVRPWFWAGIGLATVIALPNFLWQLHRQFPFLQLMANIRRNGRDIVFSPPAYLGQQAFLIGFTPVVLVLLGVWFLASARGRRYAVLAWGFLGMLGITMLLKGKGYYVGPAYPMIFASGAVMFEELTQGRRWRWARPAYAALILAIGALLGPVAFPILPVKTFIAYTHKLGIEQPKFEHQPQSVLPQLYADMFGWEDRVKMVAAYYHSLSPEEQKITAIGAPNYGQAGAIDFFGPKYGLPKAISGHQTFWLWGPREYTGESIILLNEGLPKKYEQMCRSLTLVGVPDEPYARPDDNRPIYHCRGLNPSLQELWPRLKVWD
jgi:Dolichyl-phosphate-mannose-protein mannosyltransferase